MRKLLKYILYFLFCAGNTFLLLAEDKEDSLKKYDGSTVEEVISLFHNSLGFDYLTKEESDSLNITGLLNFLDESKQYKSYFEFERILVKSYLFRGEVRMAIAQSDQMYSKSRVLSYPLGDALALNALGEVYTYTGRYKEAGIAYERALDVLDKMGGEDVHIRMLLVELIDYNILIQDKGSAGHYISRLNSYPDNQISVQELGIRHITNAQYQLFRDNVDATRQHLDQVEKIKKHLTPGIQQFLLLVNARYLVAIEDYEKALEEYDQFLQTEYSQSNNNIYKETLREKADLLEKMGRKEEAFKQLRNLFSFIKSSFDKNYPKEIEELSTRFQADQLAYQNEHDRLVSMRFYLAGILLCSILLILFLFLSWKKIFYLKRSVQRQEAMKLKAKSAIQRKNLFLSNMSHEVRTPLNAIVGFSAVLTSDDETFDDESRQEFCEIIKVNSFQLLKLINDILDFSDFENDNITFNIQTYDAVKLCNEVVETVVASRKLQVEMRFDTELTELMIDTDDTRLRQVLINLLVNAAKFTEKGSIILNLKLADDDTALFSVTDTGCGVPQEKQQLIFERFEKLNDFVQGSGLGLSICRLIVDYMNGKIWVDNQYKDGARFCFTHPLKHNPENHPNIAL